MDGNVAKLAARYAGRPVLMERGSLDYWVGRIRATDPRAFQKPGRFDALLRRLGAKREQPLAFDDDDFPPPPPLEERLVYAPRYIGQPDDTGYGWSLKNGVALMCADTPLLAHGDDFCGMVFHGYDTLLTGMREASADSRVKAIFLKLDSPGGVAAGGLMTLARWMRDNRAAAGGKPIWIHADMACSAAYWVAAGGDRIGCTPLGYTGSIGCYIVHEDLTGFYDKAGVKITEIKAFSRKTDGADWKPLSDEAKADYQAEITQIVSEFVSDVNAGRASLTPEKIEAMESRSFMAEHADQSRSALALGLIDEVIGEEEMFAALVSKISAPESTTATGLTAPGAAVSRIEEQPMTQKVAMTAAERAARKAELNKELAQLNDEAEAEEAKVDAAEDDETKVDPKAPDQDKEEPEAAKIAASEDAKKYPHLAMAAIASKQTLAQFQATVAAQASAPKKGALAEYMANSPRVGVDAPQADASSMGKALVDGAKKLAGKKA